MGFGGQTEILVGFDGRQPLSAQCITYMRGLVLKTGGIAIFSPRAYLYAWGFLFFWRFAERINYETMAKLEVKTRIQYRFI